MELICSGTNSFMEVNQMNMDERLKEAEAEQVELVTKINLLADQMNTMREQRLELLQEGLRLEGEIRVLKQLLEKGDK